MRHAFLRHNLNGGSRSFWIFNLGVLHVHVQCVHDFFQLAPLSQENPSFSWEMLTLFWTRKFASSNLRGGKRCRAKKIAVLRSANPVCADVKTERATEIRCGVRTLNHQRPHLLFWCVSLYCVSFCASEPCKRRRRRTGVGGMGSVDRSNSTGPRFRSDLSVQTSSIHIFFPQQREESDHGDIDPIQVGSLGLPNEPDSGEGISLIQPFSPLGSSSSHHTRTLELVL